MKNTVIVKTEVYRDRVSTLFFAFKLTRGSIWNADIAQAMLFTREDAISFVGKNKYTIETLGEQCLSLIRGYKPKAPKKTDPQLRTCECGCQGDYARHTRNLRIKEGQK